MSLAGRKIGLMNNDDWSMLIFRAGLVRQLLNRGAEVVLFVPPGKSVPKLEALGARVITVPMYRFISPVKDLVLILRLFRALRHEKLEILHTMTVKPNIYGAFAGWLAGIPRIVGLVSGAGTTFGGAGGFKDRIIGAITAGLYRRALTLHRRVWFQNADDAGEFARRGLLPREKAVVIRSSGVNTTDYAPGAVSAEVTSALRREFAIAPDAKCAVLIARLIWSKGIGEFSEAARLLQKDFPDWHFVMLVPWEHGNPEAAGQDFLGQEHPRNLTIVTDLRTDARTFAAIADIGVLPSYYREGVPRSLLEFMAFGAPIVTTDWIGCRETVVEGRNGFLVPVRDAPSLTGRLREMMKDEALRRRMGAESRRMAIEEFGEGVVARRIVAELYELADETQPG